MNLQGGCIAFPVGNCLFVNVNLVGDLLLEELEVKTAGADMVASQPWSLEASEPMRPI
jgi:hypothetical protein